MASIKLHDLSDIFRYVAERNKTLFRQLTEVVITRCTDIEKALCEEVYFGYVMTIASPDRLYLKIFTLNADQTKSRCRALYVIGILDETIVDRTSALPTLH